MAKNLRFPKYCKVLSPCFASLFTKLNSWKLLIRFLPFSAPSYKWIFSVKNIVTETWICKCNKVYLTLFKIHLQEGARAYRYQLRQIIEVFLMITGQYAVQLINPAKLLLPPDTINYEWHHQLNPCFAPSKAAKHGSALIISKRILVTKPFCHILKVVGNLLPNKAIY